MVTITPTELAFYAGAVLSLVFSYVPGVKDWYEPLNPTKKRLVMLGLLLLTAVGVLAYQCRGDGACYTATLETVISAFVSAVIANQAAFALTPKAEPAPAPVVTPPQA